MNGPAGGWTQVPRIPSETIGIPELGLGKLAAGGVEAAGISGGGGG
jgi:hypothetical protein